MGKRGRPKFKCPEMSDELIKIIMRKLREENMSYQEICDFLNIYAGINISKTQLTKCFPQFKKKVINSDVGVEDTETTFLPTKEPAGTDVEAEDIIDWMQSKIHVMSKHDGGVISYTYTGREFYIDVHRSYVDNTTDTVVLKGRQVEASTSFINVMFYLIDHVPSFTIAHVFPSEVKANKFSREKINEFFLYNPFFAERLATDVSNTVYDKGIYSSAGTLSWYRMTFVGGRKSEDIRSMSVDVLGLDEFDDFPAEAMGALIGSTLHSTFGKRIYLFTPKLPRSPSTERWEQSKMKKWYYVCSACGVPNHLDLEHISKVNGKYEYVCENCNQILDKKVRLIRNSDNLLVVDPTTGFWKAENPDGELDGYFINQLMLPYMSAGDIMNFYSDPSISRKAFWNEIMGVPYAGEDMPITISRLMQLTQENLTLGIVPKNCIARTMGIDWGAQSYFVKLCLTSAGTYVMYDAGVIKGSQEDHLAFVMEELYKDQDLKVVVDRGYDLGRTMKLQNIFGDRVWGVVYQGEKRAVWQIDNVKKTEYKDYKIVINHTAMVDGVIDVINEGLLTLPYAPEVQNKMYNIIKNMSLITKDTVERTTKNIMTRRIEYNTNRAHYFMSLLYALLDLHFKPNETKALVYINANREPNGFEPFQKPAEVFSMTRRNYNKDMRKRKKELRKWLLNTR